jgi:hypothetical protein
MVQDRFYLDYNDNNSEFEICSQEIGNYENPLNEGSLTVLATFSYSGGAYGVTHQKQSYIDKDGDSITLRFTVYISPTFEDVSYPNVVNGVDFYVWAIGAYSLWKGGVATVTISALKKILELNSLCSAGGGSVDLTEVNTKLDNIQSKIDTNLNKKSSDIYNKVNSTNTKVNTNLDSKISEISIDLTPLQNSINNLVGFDFSGSLNGTSGSYPDSTKVSIEGYVGEYEVSSSNVMKYDDNLHIIVYRCKKDDKYFNVPSNMVSLYVAPTP